MKFGIWVFFRKSVEKIQVSLNSDKNNWYYHCTFMKISRSFLLRMGNVSDKSCRENQNTYSLFSNFFPFENRAVYEITGKIWYSGADHRWQYGAWILHARYLRLQIHTHTHTHTQVVWYALLFHRKDGCTNAPQCYVIRTLPVLCTVYLLRNTLTSKTEATYERIILYRTLKLVWETRDCIHLAQDNDQWRVLMVKVKNFWILRK